MHSLNAEIIVTDNKTGKVLVHKQAESFVINFLNLLYCQFASSTLANCTDTGGTLRTASPTGAQSCFNHTQGAGAATLGIVVGTGTNAVTLTDTKLQTAIAHGVGAGQLSYGGSSWLSPVTSGSDRYYEVSRTLTNSSGSSITINEVALYMLDGGGFTFCMDRTLSTFVVANAGTVTITYRVKVTV